MDIKNIGKTIAEQRKKLNMSQKDLADKLNVSNKTISKWECGNGIPDIESLDKLARAFGITLDELLNPPSETPEIESVDSLRESTHISTTKNKPRKLLLSLIITCSLVFALATSLLCYFFIPRKPEIINTDKFYIDKQSSIVSCTVDNAIERFSFSDSIEVPMTNKWNVYYDLNGMHAINSQTVNLQVGDNTFYIVVENSAGDKKTYQVIIRRKPLYVVTFNTNGGETIVNEIVMEDNFATYQEPVREGYIFNSWDFDFTQPITQNITVNATWIAKNLTVTYYANNGTDDTSTQDITYDDEISFKTDNAFSKEGYALSGWNTKADGNGTQYSVGQTFNNFQVSETDFNLYAQWTVNQYTITATKNLQNAGSINGIGSFDYGTVQTLTALTNTGYTWDGWYSKDNTLVSKSQNLTVTIGSEGQEYVAKWTANKYSVSLNVNGGNTLSQNSQELVFGESFVLPVPTRTEAVFLGWFDIDNNKYANNAGISVKNWDIANPTTLYAHYKINEYQVSLSENIDVGGTVQGFGLKEYGSNVTIIAQPNTGYSFVGWYSGTTIISSLAEYSFAMPNTPVSYIAKWKANTYNVTMDVNGGDSLANDKKTLTFDSSYNLPITTKTGYSFGGWYTGNNGTGTQLTDSLGNSIGVWNIADNTTVYAKWNVITYTLTFHLNGGIVSGENATTYTIEDLDITINNPIKAGYVFDGWIENGSTEPIITLVISAGTFGNRTFGAKWSRSSSFVAISNIAEFRNIANNLNGYYYLTEDIDFEKMEIASFGSEEVAFTGVFDGNGHKLINLQTTKGIFFNLKGTVCDLYVDNIINYSEFMSTKVYSLGSIAFKNEGLIQRCVINSGLVGTSVGGVVHTNNGVIEYCKVLGAVVAGQNYPNASTASGICVENNGSIKNSYVLATVSANASHTIGRAASIACYHNGTIENCIAIGDVKAWGDTYACAGRIIATGEGSLSNTYFSSKQTIFSEEDSCYTVPTTGHYNKTGTQLVSFNMNFINWNLYKNYYDLIANPHNIWREVQNDYPKLYWES